MWRMVTMFKSVKEVTHNSLMYSDSNCDVFYIVKTLLSKKVWNASSVNWKAVHNFREHNRFKKKVCFALCVSFLVQASNYDFTIWANPRALIGRELWFMRV